MNKYHQPLTRSIVSGDRESHIFVSGYCCICNKEYSRTNYKWMDHKDTKGHKQAKENLLKKFVLFVKKHW